jgi:RNA polymerase sigma factor (TIGR02999 family)
LIGSCVFSRPYPRFRDGSGEAHMAPDSAMHVSELLLDWGRGDRAALKEILPLVYDELRRLARHHLRQQRPNHTLQTTALVHEAYLRLAEEDALHVKDRAHFLGIAAQLMRWILVDYERSRRTAKRGAGATRLTLDSSAVQGEAYGGDIDLLALNEALDKLAKLDSQQSRIVELRYFGGLTVEDTSEFLGISATAVNRRWSSARIWLRRELRRGKGPA